jgi:hypothetical protein
MTVAAQGNCHIVNLSQYRNVNWQKFFQLIIKYIALNKNRIYNKNNIFYHCV